MYVDEKTGFKHFAIDDGAVREINNGKNSNMVSYIPCREQTEYAVREKIKDGSLKYFKDERIEDLPDIVTLVNRSSYLNRFSSIHSEKGYGIGSFSYTDNDGNQQTISTIEKIDTNNEDGSSKPNIDGFLFELTNPFTDDSVIPPCYSGDMVSYSIYVNSDFDDETVPTVLIGYITDDSQDGNVAIHAAKYGPIKGKIEFAFSMPLKSSQYFIAVNYSYGTFNENSESYDLLLGSYTKSACLTPKGANILIGDATSEYSASLEAIRSIMLPFHNYTSKLTMSNTMPVTIDEIKDSSLNDIGINSKVVRIESRDGEGSAEETSNMFLRYVDGGDDDITEFIGTGMFITISGTEISVYFSVIKTLDSGVTEVAVNVLPTGDYNNTLLYKPAGCNVLIVKNTDADDGTVRIPITSDILKYLKTTYVNGGN